VFVFLRLPHSPPWPSCPRRPKLHRELYRLRTIRTPHPAARLPAADWALLCLFCLFLTGCRTFTVSEVSPGIFKGSRPAAAADYEMLRTKGVRTIVSLEMLPWHTRPERRMARRYGFNYCEIPILASPLPPSEESVREALAALEDPALRPVYVHCLVGEDRTLLIVGLYRVYFEDWPPQAAWDEMLRSNFHSGPQLRGFTTYYWSHTNKPAWVRQLRATRPAAPP
jgi:protein-tyrosine phosphatase